MRAEAALAAAVAMPPGPDRVEALKTAGALRNAAWLREHGGPVDDFEEIVPRKIIPKKNDHRKSRRMIIGSKVSASSRRSRRQSSSFALPRHHAVVFFSGL